MPLLAASQFLSAGSGGISRVARLTLRAAIDDGRKVEALAASDTSRVVDLPANVRNFSGNRVRFAVACQAAALKCDHVFYDFAGTARVHMGIPYYERPYAVWIHGMEVWEGLRRDRMSKIAGAETVVANSHFTRGRAGELHGDAFARSRVCWLGTPEDEPGLISARRSERPPLVLVVARIETGRDKGHDALIAAWPQILASVPDARLVIAGHGTRLEEVQRLAARSPASANIDVLGFVSEERLERLFSEASVFAMPSRGEGFGLVYIEAMRHSVPVIASVHDAGQEVNLDGVTGYNVDLDRRGELAERLVGLLCNRDQAAAMGRSGLKRWRDHFSYSRFRERFTPILRDFVRGG